MKTKYNIVIAGIGGVGGFCGAKLAQAFSGSEEVEINFLARGAHLDAIRKTGLQLETDQEKIVANPNKASADPKELGKPDLIIFCCKSYDLESTAELFRPFVQPGTLLLPLLNGVDNSARLKNVFPGNQCLEGLTYMVSRIVAPGSVKQSGAVSALYFGGPYALKKEMEFIEKIFSDAKINATLHPNILQMVWQKFLFISPVATYTSAYNISFGAILKEKEHSERLEKLMNELRLLAGKLHVYLPDDVIEKNFELIKKLPDHTTSSMQLDFSNKRKTELETLTGFVVRKSQEQGLKLELYETMYNELLKKIAEGK
jgi:2-dehydropantoate 2-reductase